MATTLKATTRLHQTTTATPEQFIAGLTDVGPDRSKLFKNSAYAYLRVHREAPAPPGRRNCRSGRRDVTAYPPSRGASMRTHITVDVRAYGDWTYAIGHVCRPPP
jgi:hypothetical protein